MPYTDPDDFLRAFHAEFPGATTEIAARGKSEQGSSYQVLAKEVPTTTKPITVLDLACGDGYLLELLLRRQQSNLQLIGVDMSRHELEAACQRLGPTFALVNEKAKQLPVPDESVDVVLCHMALMFMAPLEPVIVELHRILRPGGIFSAIIGSPSQSTGPVLRTFGMLLHQFIERSGRVPPDLGDARSHNTRGLETLFGPSNGFEQLELQEMTFQLEALWTR